MADACPLMYGNSPNVAPLIQKGHKVGDSGVHVQTRIAYVCTLGRRFEEIKDEPCFRA